jgi:hypothetical protein
MRTTYSMSPFQIPIRRFGRYLEDKWEILCLVQLVQPGTLIRCKAVCWTATLILDHSCEFQSLGPGYYYIVLLGNTQFRKLIASCEEISLPTNHLDILKADCSTQKPVPGTLVRGYNILICSTQSRPRYFWLLLRRHCVCCEPTCGREKWISRAMDLNLTMGPHTSASIVILVWKRFQVPFNKKKSCAVLVSWKTAPGRRGAGSLKLNCIFCNIFCKALETRFDARVSEPAFSTKLFFDIRISNLLYSG